MQKICRISNDPANHHDGHGGQWHLSPWHSHWCVLRKLLATLECKNPQQILPAPLLPAFNGFWYQKYHRNHHSITRMPLKQLQQLTPHDINSLSLLILPVPSSFPHVLLLSLNSTTSLQQKDDLDEPGHLLINSPTAAQWHAANNHHTSALPSASLLPLCFPSPMPSYLLPPHCCRSNSSSVTVYKKALAVSN